MIPHLIPLTYGQLVQKFTALGIKTPSTVMLHASVNAVGPIIGGPNVILQALLDVLTPGGTLMMYAGWQDHPDFADTLPHDLAQLYRSEHPPFDPAVSRAVRENSILAEFLRTWPGTQRSQNPEASMVANGAEAASITRDHPLNYGYGASSPLEKLVQRRGQVLMLGAPLDTITLLHYAENRARLRSKNIVRYQCPILQHGIKIWIDIEDFDTGETHADYSFDEIARAYLAIGNGRRMRIGGADTYLFDAAGLVDFAIGWLESRFG